MKTQFRRLVGKRRYKRMFVIVAEGTVSEFEYFRILDSSAIVHIRCLRNRNNLPPEEALKRVQEFVAEEGLRNSDEAWVVVDRDAWPEKHLAAIHAWSQGKKNFGFALSNPKFEYWLLLHFENGGQVTTANECDRRLAKYIPDYDKHISSQHFTKDRIKSAVDRAKKRDTPPCETWPRQTGSTVYRVVERILKSQG